MYRNRIMTGLMILLLIAVVAFTGSCQKLKISTLRANYYFNQANHSFTENEYRQAIEQYEKALEYNPELVQAYQYLGESYKQMYRPGDDSEDNVERAQKALEALNKAYEIDPNDKNVIHSLADMYNRMQDFKEAEKFYLKILEMEPTNLSNYYVVAEFYKSYAGQTEEKEGEEGEVTEKTPFEKAEEMYLRRIETDPDNPQGLSYIAQFYGSINPIPDFDKAVYYYKLQTKLDPDNAVAWYSIGATRFFHAYRLQNQLTMNQKIALGKEAEEALLKSIELDANYPEPYAYMKILYVNIFAPLYPERRDWYNSEANRYGDLFQELRERILERKQLKKELTRIE